MSEFSTVLLAALALILVIEGLAYGLFAGWVKRYLPVMIDSLSEEQLRWGGLTVAALGLFLLWLLRG